MFVDPAQTFNTSCPELHQSPLTNHQSQYQIEVEQQSVYQSPITNHWPSTVVSLTPIGLTPLGPTSKFSKRPVPNITNNNRQMPSTHSNNTPYCEIPTTNHQPNYTMNTTTIPVVSLIPLGPAPNFNTSCPVPIVPSVTTGPVGLGGTPPLPPARPPLKGCQTR